MKVFPNKLDSYLKDLIGIKAILLYGPNYGLTHIISNKIIKSFIPSDNDVIMNEQPDILYSDIIKSDPTVLTNKIFTTNLFGEEQKIIIIKNGTDNITKIISNCIELPSYPTKTIIVVIAGELSPSSSIKKLFEQHKKTLSIACYLNNQEQTKQLITNFFKLNNITAEADVITYLSHNLSADSLLATNDLNSLLLYIYPTKHIILSNIQDIFQDQSLITMDKFINALFLKNTVAAYSILSKLLVSTNPVMIITVIKNYIYKLHLVKAAIQNGMNNQEAMKLLYPPIFFANQPAFTSSLSLYSLTELKRLTDDIIKIDIQLKSYSTIGEILIKQFVINFQHYSNTKQIQTY